VCSRIESFVVGPSYDNLVNIGTCDYTCFHTAGKYWSVMLRESKGGTPSLFYTVGIVSHFDLVTGNNSHQICVVPTDLSWARIAAVMGMFFKQKKLALSAFKNGISFHPKTQRQCIPTHEFTRHIHAFLFQSANGTLSKCASTIQLHIVPTFDGRAPFRLPEYKDLQKYTQK